MSEPDNSAGLPLGTVSALLGSGRVSKSTRNALEARLEAEPTAPRFFDAHEFELLRAVCAQLVASPTGPDIDIAGTIDTRLAEGRGDGWRYDSMPADGEALRRGLAGIDEAAAAIGGKPFLALDGRVRDEVLAAVQCGAPPGAAWNDLPAARFFEELLAEVADIHFSHPLVQERIGYLGFADVLGWHALGLDEVEYPEPPLARGPR